MLKAVGDYPEGAIVFIEDRVGRRYISAKFAEEYRELTINDPILHPILAEAEKLRDDPRHTGKSPLGWTAMLNDASERIYQFTAAADPEDQARNLAEIRATAVRAAALGVLVARLADQGRRS
jgi:hypothetical protein